MSAPGHGCQRLKTVTPQGSLRQSAGSQPIGFPPDGISLAIGSRQLPRSRQVARAHRRWDLACKLLRALRVALFVAPRDDAPPRARRQEGQGRSAHSLQRRLIAKEHVEDLVCEGGSLAGSADEPFDQPAAA